MGYTFTIGNAVPEFSKDDGELSARWVVEPASNDKAPTFPNDEMTGNTNSRSPSYSGWPQFCDAAGLHDLFYGASTYGGGVLVEHPGCVILKRSDLESVRESLARWQARATLPPGFEKTPGYDDETGQWLYPDEGKYDSTLARLIWLEWWMAWALDNCETPAIQNT